MIARLVNLFTCFIIAISAWLILGIDVSIALAVANSSMVRFLCHFDVVSRDTHLNSIVHNIVV